MIMSKTLRQLARLSRRLWLRSALFSLLAVVTALLALPVKPYIPANLPGRIGSDAVDNLLTILGSSMLTVTTFTLNIMISSYASVSGSATPRATRLLIEDPTSQNVLATFLGSFLFSLVGIIVLKTGLYGDQGRVVLFIVTIFVVAMIVATFLRWIGHLSTLGRLSDAVDRVEEATREALQWRLEHPWLGGLPPVAEQGRLEGAIAVFTPQIGFIDHVDVAALDAAAESFRGTVHICAQPGAFVDPTRPVAYFETAREDGEPPADRDPREVICGCFNIATTRSYEQDPRFGILVLSEIASRALSPAVNDPGTAIDVMSRLVRLLALLRERENLRPEETLYPRVHAPPLRTRDLMNDAFRAIARDGAALFEVGVRLQKSLAILARLGVPQLSEAAMEQSAIALARAEAALTVEQDRAWVRILASRVDPASASGEARG
jgi:uncharacterized membrane protein